MLNRILTLFVLMTLLSCGSQTDNQNSNSSDTSRTSINKQNDDTAYLTFQKFKNSKWIVGEVGLNGEMPDTIIFSKPDTLTYISTDTGKEFCFYKFDKDTLTYFSYSVEADLNSADDISCKTENKLHFENGIFTYVYFDKLCTGDKVAKRIRMDTLNVRFRKL